MMRVVRGGKFDKELHAEALTEAAKTLETASLTMLTAILKAFSPPSFQVTTQQADEIIWPKSHADLTDAPMEPQILAAIGAVMREWARVELLFNANIKAMSKYMVGDKPLEDADIELISFKAKAIQWRRVQAMTFKDEQHLVLAKGLLSNAKRLVSIRNELAHWNNMPRDPMPGFLVLVEVKDVGPNQTTEHVIWSAKHILDIAADIAKLRIALVAFTRLLMMLRAPPLSLQLSPSSAEIIAELRSDTALRTLQSYLAQRQAFRPPRRPGLPPQPEPFQV